MGVLIKTLFKEANHLTSHSYKSVSTKENIEQNFKNVHKVSYVMYTSCPMWCTQVVLCDVHKVSYVLCTIQSSVVRYLSDVNTEI